MTRDKFTLNVINDFTEKLRKSDIREKFIAKLPFCNELCQGKFCLQFVREVPYHFDI